jgi:O-antigen/teichoic acid export membrane protein
MLRIQKYKLISSIKIIQTTLNNGLTILFGFAKIGAIGLAAGWLISQIIIVSSLISKFSKKINVNIRKFNKNFFFSTLIEFKEFPLINSLHAFLDVFAIQFLLFWIITISFGKWELGIFAFTFKYVGAPIGLISSSISQIFYVEMGNAINNKKQVKHIFNKTIKISLIFAILFSIVILLFGQKLFAWYFGSDWKIGGLYAQYCLPVIIGPLIISPLSWCPMLFKKQFINFLINLISYSLCILGFLFSIFLKLNFQNALIIYSIIKTIHFIVVFLWFKKLINNYENSLYIE